MPRPRFLSLACAVLALGALLAILAGCEKQYSVGPAALKEQCERLTKQRDEARAELARVKEALEVHKRSVDCLDVDKEIFIKVPYSKAFAELVGHMLLHRELAPPGPHRIAGKRVMVRINDPHIVRSVDGGEWQPVHPYIVCEYDFGCVYDNHGSYLVPLALYRANKDHLIQNHHGRLEYFRKPNPDPTIDEWELFVWDAQDHCWRWPVTLERVAREHKLKNGDKLYDEKVDPKLETGRLGEMLEEAKDKGRFPKN